MKITKSVVLMIFIFFVLTFITSVYGAQKGNLFIGWASESITPSKPAYLRGQMYKRISEYVRDPITTTALAFETKETNGNSEQAIMISCDQVAISKATQDKVRERVKERIADFKVNNLFLNATHTHTAPCPEGSIFYDSGIDEGVMTYEEFGEFLVERIVEAAVKAWKNRKPGGVSWGLGHAVVGHNRRVEYTDGSTVMYGSTDTERFKGLEGPSDHGVDMVFCWDTNSELTGVIINLACPSQIVESERYISADFWGEVRKELRDRYSEALFILPQCGAAGDQSPRDLPRRKRGEPDMREEEGLIEIGERIADAVDRVYPRAKNTIVTKLIFKHTVENIDLPLRRVTEKEYEDALSAYTMYTALKEQESLKEKFSDDFTDPFIRIMGNNKKIIDRYLEQRSNPYYTIDLHVIRLGDVAFANNPFELFLDYGLQIIARSKAEQTFIIQLSGDSGGYLPTARAIQGGGYSAYIYSNKVGPQGGEVLVNETVKRINNMWE
ncbi:MAG: hypothetical protein JXB48_19170 [Candidatus Latescibacteria bacterium]|nr:hypothetical protein [Candidatus Latescibacterota bacterium]